MADAPRAHQPPGRDDARGEEATFFDYCAAGEVRIQRCEACAAHVYPPRGVCPWCFGLELAWVPIDGRGTIYSFTEQRRPGPGFPGAEPYVIALVDLVEGARMLGRLRAASGPTIGDPVVVRIAEPTPDWPVPVFEPPEVA